MWLALLIFTQLCSTRERGRERGERVRERERESERERKTSHFETIVSSNFEKSLLPKNKISMKNMCHSTK
jgi:hypothetical protein